MSKTYLLLKLPKILIIKLVFVVSLCFRITRYLFRSLSILKSRNLAIATNQKLNLRSLLYESKKENVQISLLISIFMFAQNITC